MAGVNQFTSAMTLPKHIAYSEPRLQPRPGYKDTTVPGIFSRDTLFSHGNHEPGWVAAPGMQGVDVQHLQVLVEGVATLAGFEQSAITLRRDDVCEVVAAAGVSRQSAESGSTVSPALTWHLETSAMVVVWVAMPKPISRTELNTRQ